MAMLTGASLKKIREERGIPLERVAQATRIRLAILEDLEVDDYSSLSSLTQARGFLRLYADYLGINPEPAPLNPPAETSQPLPAPAEAPETPPGPKPPKVQRKAAASKKQASKPAANPSEASPSAANTESPQSLSPAQEILMEIGRELAARRKYMNVSWEVIEDHTHLRQDQIRALEAGDLDFFANTMQAKGLLQTYVRFLNLESQHIMSRFADALQQKSQQARGPEGGKKKASRRVLPPWLLAVRRFFTLDLFFGSLLVLGITFFLIWGISRLTESTETASGTGTLPAVADVLMTTPSAPAFDFLATPSASAAAGGVQLPTITPFYTPQITDAALELIVLSHQNTWVRVTVDGEIAYQGRLNAGNVQTFTAEESILLETGNLAAVEMIFNQEPFSAGNPALGDSARILFDLNGITREINPGAVESTPTPSPTPRPTPTTLP